MAETTQYIGITGFMTPDEIVTIQQLFPAYGPIKLMVGILVSGKTLSGQTNKYPKKYPRVTEIHELFDAIDPARAYGLVHFSTGREDLRVELGSLLDIIQREDRHLPASFAGFQYNLAWPQVRSLYQMAIICGARYDLDYRTWANRSVLQLGPRVLEEHTMSIINRLRDYDSASGSGDDPILSHALIDMSGGVGMEMDLRHVQELLTALRDCGYLTNLNWAVAGGLDAENVGKLRSMVQDYPNLSIDAEGRLRNTEGDLDLDKARRYVENALGLLSG